MDFRFECGGGAPFEAGRDLRAVVLCEDNVTTDKAVDVLHLLHRQLKDEAGRLFYQWWNFEFLAVPELSERFVAQTGAADLIIVGIHKRLAFPARFTDWLERLPELRQKRTGAMVVLLDSAGEAPEWELAMFAQLKAAAALSWMDFFATGAATGVDPEAIHGACRPGLSRSMPAVFRDSGPVRFRFPG